MASNHTEHFSLNQWQADDQVLRTDFNEDNAKIDSALKDLAAAQAEKADQTALDALAAEVAKKATTAALEALHHTDPDATLLEVNTGAISRGYRDTPYPAVFLLREWRGMGGQIILTADAHSPETVVYGYGQAAELARAAGFRECVLLTGRGWKPCPL